MQLKVKYKTVSLYEYLANMRTRKEENAIFKKFGGTIWVQGRQSDFFFKLRLTNLQLEIVTLSL